MEATSADVSTAPIPPHRDYVSRPGALIWSFRKSRDRWKSKYQALKASLKRSRNRVADVTKSRERWRLHAEQATARLAALEAEAAALRAQVAARPVEKKRTGACPR